MCLRVKVEGVECEEMGRGDERCPMLIPGWRGGIGGWWQEPPRPPGLDIENEPSEAAARRAFRSSRAWCRAEDSLAGKPHNRPRGSGGSVYIAGFGGLVDIGGLARCGGVDTGTRPAWWWRHRGSVAETPPTYLAGTRFLLRLKGGA
uniref:Uncharacterized protein n=1 Tax=Sphaerodactylus townsendi TaxID=933632 RepID=A0ACB8GBU8_9SAUR